MNSDDLIARLADGVSPTPRAFVLKTLAAGLGGGVLVSAVLMALWLGVRPDLAEAAQGWPFWMKFFYTLAFALAGFAVVERLARPGAAPGRRAVIEALPFAILAALALWQWSAAPVSQHAHLFYGASHLVCPWRIAALSLPIFLGVLWSLRKLAPTRPLLAGLAAGLLAGASGAFVYAFHCDESAAVFVAVWYTLGIAAMGALGALLGRFVLRW